MTELVVSFLPPTGAMLPPDSVLLHLLPLRLAFYRCASPPAAALRHPGVLRALPAGGSSPGALTASDERDRSAPCRRPQVVLHLPHDHAIRSLLGMSGICLAVGSVVLAPVPVVGPALSGAGVVLCWMGRNSEFGRGARLCLWINTVALCVGVAVTVWFIHRHW